MELSTSQKVQTLLFLHKFQYGEIHRREEREQKWFEWTASSILVAFGVVLALSRNSIPIPYPIIIKTLASVLITLPTLLISWRMFKQINLIVKNAEAVEYIEAALKVFKKDYYGVPKLYPEEWEGNLALDYSNRKIQRTYVSILMLMAVCVIATIWIVL